MATFQEDSLKRYARLFRAKPVSAAGDVGQFPAAMRQFGTGPVVPETFAPPPQAVGTLPESVPGSGRTLPRAAAALLTDRDELAASHRNRLGIIDAARALGPVPVPDITGADAITLAGQQAFAQNAALAGGGRRGYNPALAGAVGRHGLSSRTLASGYTQPLDPGRPKMNDLGPRAASVQKDLDAQALAEARLVAARAAERLDLPDEAASPGLATSDDIFGDVGATLGSDDKGDLGPTTLEPPSTDPELNKKRAQQIGDYNKRMGASMKALDRAAKAQVAGNTDLYDQEIAIAAAEHPGPMVGPMRGDSSAKMIRARRQAARQARLGLDVSRPENLFTPEASLGRQAKRQDIDANILAERSGISRERRARQQMLEREASGEGGELSPAGALALGGMPAYAATLGAQTERLRIGAESIDDPAARAAGAIGAMGGLGGVDAASDPEGAAVMERKTRELGDDPAPEGGLGRPPSEQDYNDAVARDENNVLGELMRRGFSRVEAIDYLRSRGLREAEEEKEWLKNPASMINLPGYLTRGLGWQSASPPPLARPVE